MPALLALARRLIDRVVPRGALTLSILSLAYFGMGLIRNRVFANTFGAGAELDAYNAAFRIPESAVYTPAVTATTPPAISQSRFSQCSGETTICAVS